MFLEHLLLGVVTPKVTERPVSIARAAIQLLLALFYYVEYFRSLMYNTVLCMLRTHVFIVFTREWKFV